MRPSLEPVALSAAKLSSVHDLVYDLQIVQQPKNTRESTAKKAYTISRGVKTEKLYKRLLNPHPILSLSVYGRPRGGDARVDVTSRILSQFFVKVSLVSARSEQPAKGNHSYLIGTTSTSGSFYTLKDTQQTFIVFKLDDIGIIKDGTFKLRFDLFELKHIDPASQLKSINLVASVVSSDIVIFKANEYYKGNNQVLIKSQIQNEIKKAGSHSIIKYLTSIKVLKYDDALLSATKRSAGQQKNNVSPQNVEMDDDSLFPSKDNDPLFLSKDNDPLPAGKHDSLFTGNNECSDSCKNSLNSDILRSQDNESSPSQSIFEDPFATTSFSFINNSRSSNLANKSHSALQPPSSSSSSSSISTCSTSSVAFSKAISVNSPGGDAFIDRRSKSLGSTNFFDDNISLLLSSYANDSCRFNLDSFQNNNGKNKYIGSKRCNSISKNAGNTNGYTSYGLRKLSEPNLINTLERHFSANNKTSQNGLVNNRLYSGYKSSTNSPIAFSTFSSGNSSSSASSDSPSDISPSEFKNTQGTAADLCTLMKEKEEELSYEEFLKVASNRQQNAISINTEAANIFEDDDDEFFTPLVTPAAPIPQHYFDDNDHENSDLQVLLQLNFFEKTNNSTNTDDTFQEALATESTYDDLNEIFESNNSSINYDNSNLLFNDEL